MFAGVGALCATCVAAPGHIASQASSAAATWTIPALPPTGQPDQPHNDPGPYSPEPLPGPAYSGTATSTHTITVADPYWSRPQNSS